MTNEGETRHPAVAAYVAAVRDELGDIRSDEAAEIAEDVREHLDQVAAEYGDAVSLGVLIDRLGAPAAYAAELRAAAGLAERAPAPESPRFGRRLLRFTTSVFALAAAGFTVAAVADILFSLSGAPAIFVAPAAICALVASASFLLLVLRRGDPTAELRRLPGAGHAAAAQRWMRAKPWGEPTLEVIAGLRPAWWIVRAALLGLAVAFVTNTSFGGAVFLLALVPSVWLGRKAASGQVVDRARMAVLGANAALAVGGAFVVAAAVAEIQELRFGGAYAYAGDDPYAEYDPYAQGDPYAVGFSDADGMAVENIYPYGPDGALLQNVRLYDQNGRPIELASSPPCEEDPWMMETFYLDNPWGSNLYPRMRVQVNENGTCQEPEIDPPHGTQLPGAAAIPPEPRAETGTGAEGGTAAPTPGSHETGVPSSTPESEPGKGS